MMVRHWWGELGTQLQDDWALLSNTKHPIFTKTFIVSMVMDLAQGNQLHTTLSHAHTLVLQSLFVFPW